LKNLTRVFAALCAEKNFADVVGRVMLCDKDVKPPKPENKNNKGKGKGKK